MQRDLCKACLLITWVLAVSGQAYKLQFTNGTAAKAEGSVLVLDVGSLWQKHPADPPFGIATAAECQQRCAVLPGCTAYRFCNKQAGCGSGCKAYAAKYPQAKAASAGPNKRGERSSDASSWLALPLLGFGPFLAIDSTPSQGCHPGDSSKWAFGTCSLLAGRQQAKASSAAEADGWLSAWLTSALPSQCAGLSASACAACAATPAPALCLSCMRDKRAQDDSPGAALVAASVVPPGSQGARVLDQCVTCAQAPGSALQQKCVACVLDDQSCSSCVAHPTAATRVKLAAMDGCIGCVQARGKRFTGTCLTCAVTPDPSKCYSCLASFYPKHLCRTTTYLDCYKPDFDNPCASCQSGAPAAYSSCIRCYGTPSSRADCDSCSQLPGADAQQQCYACSKTAAAAHSDTPGGCGVCFAQSSSPAAQKACLACVTNKSTAQDNRQHCSLCSSGDLSEAQTRRCYSCVSSKAGSASCADCSRATSSDAAFAACMACYANPNNGPDCADCSTLEVPGSAAAWDAARKQCYGCVTASKLVAPEDAGFAPLGSCASCFTASGDTARCVACNTSPATPVAAKSWCLSCSMAGGSSSSGSGGGCVKCLQSSKLASADDYKKKCKL